MPARPFERFRPPTAWSSAIAAGRLILESPFPADKRSNPIANDRTRNRALAYRAASELVANAHLNGGVKRMALDLIASPDKLVCMLELGGNAVLRAIGAKPHSWDSNP